jgi:hypothetical protein
VSIRSKSSNANLLITNHILCPMSPFLFLLVVEGLSRIIIAMRRGGKFMYIRMQKSPFLMHLLSVDDVELFGMGTMRESRKYKDILNICCKVIGMEVNVHKSSTIFIGLEEDVEN